MQAVGNPFLPETAAALSSADALADAAKKGEKCYFDSVARRETAGGGNAGDVNSRGAPKIPETAAWFMGSMGGSHEEEQALLDHGVKPLHSSAASA